MTIAVSPLVGFDVREWAEVQRNLLFLGLCAVLLSLVALSTYAPAGPVESELSADCPLDGPPPKIGPLPYSGHDGNQFEYEADAGDHDRIYYYRVGVKNTGQRPLTVDWKKPAFFRRGIRPGVFASGQCLPDGNSPNQDIDTIDYGPNTQFSGPRARFYRPSPSSSSRIKRVTVAYDAVLGSGRVIPVRLALTSSTEAPKQVRYSFSNEGAAVRVRWRAIEGPLMFNAATAQLEPNEWNAQAGFKLTPKKALQLYVSGGNAEIRTVVHILEVFTNDGILIYRDLAPALTFDKIPSYIVPLR